MRWFPVGPYSAALVTALVIYSLVGHRVRAGYEHELPAVVVTAPAPKILEATSVIKPIVIGDDDGGRVEDHLKFYDRILAAGTPVRIEGICLSSCTFVTILPATQVCIAKTATLGFHAASTNGRQDLPYTEVLIRRYYPKSVQDWLAAWSKKNGPLTVARMAYMPASEVVSLGIFPSCEPTAEPIAPNPLDSVSDVLKKMIEQGGFGTVTETGGK